MGRLDDILEDRALRRWARAAERAGAADASALRALRQRARRLVRRVEAVLDTTETRLARLPAIARPLHADWAWRPGPWRGPVRPNACVSPPSGRAFGDETKVFHDCPRGEVSLRQSLVPGAGGFGVEIEVFHFAGTFLSLAIDLPEAALAGLTRRHVLRVALDMQAEREVSVFGRLNLRHGPNVAQVADRFEGAGAPCVEFDLAGVDFEVDRVTGAWIDVIWESPVMNRLRLADVTMTRRPRAEF